MPYIRWSGLPLICLLLLSGQATFAQSLAEQVNTMRSLHNGQRPMTDMQPTATAADPSDQSFTVPSLWWQQQQQGEAINRRLIENWWAYDSTVSSNPHVDVMVNGQIWPLLNYLEQYAFITQFGESTKVYGYQLRVFTGNRLVGLYVCDFVSDMSRHNPDGAKDTVEPNSAPQCRVVDLDYFGQGAIRGGRQR